MKKSQKTVLWLVLVNLAAILLFPPFDDYSVTHHDIAIFGGFRFAFGQPSNAQINVSLLYLEVAVVLINAGIFWLLTLEGRLHPQAGRFNYRKATLLLISANLLLVMLFPPFEYISHMTRATIPTFEGFYFVFAAPPYRVVVTPILYLETMFVLVNGGLLLLAFRERRAAGPDAGQAIAMLTRLRDAGTGRR